MRSGSLASIESYAVTKPAETCTHDHETQTNPMEPLEKSMKTARDVLVEAIEEQRPIVLLLGQDAWSEPRLPDPVLRKALEKLGRDGAATNRSGWPSTLGTQPIPNGFYDWLAERFDRRVHPPWITILNAVPWSAIFTSTTDQTLKTLFQTGGREPEITLTADERPRSVRSRARPPLLYLFGCAGWENPHCRPPANRSELTTRRIRHALPMLNRMLDTATSLGVVVIDGFSGNSDWLKPDDVLGAVGTSGPQQILWFGDRPAFTEDDAIDFESAVSSGQILLEESRLGSVLSELKAVGRLIPPSHAISEAAGVISFSNNRQLETTPEERLRVEAVSSIVDDTWTAFLPPLGPDAEYDSFRRFHGDLGGPRLLVEGIRRHFAIQRDFEDHLFRLVNRAVNDHASVNGPIILHGQSGTGKSIALARIVALFRSSRAASVLYGLGRLPQPEQIATFCEESEKAGANATLIVCDANRDLDPYRDLLMSLRSQGRRVVVLGTGYLRSELSNTELPLHVEAPNQVSTREQQSLSELLTRFFPEQRDMGAGMDTHILAFLYRWLPLSRERIAAGLGSEARFVEGELRDRGRTIRPSLPDTLLATKLAEAGILEQLEPIFNKDQVDVLEAADEPGRIIDLVMIAGALNCFVPVNLLLRSISDNIPGANIALIGDMFRDLDLFRWKWADNEQTELLVLPRLRLEAELICKRRLGSAEKEAERLVELMAAVRGGGVDGDHERLFLLNLLQQIGDDGPRGPRYQGSYVKFARCLTTLRDKHGLVSASVMLQESAFRRAAVRHSAVADEERLALLEEGRDAVQVALDGIDNGTIRAAPRTRQNLQGERATLYGFLAYDRASRAGSPEEVWSAYQAARTAIRQAVSVSDNYYPLDIGLWTPADILEIATLTDLQRSEIEADIYSTLDQVDTETLSPRQQVKFRMRQMRVGGVLEQEGLTEEGYAALEAAGSTAGYYLRARALAPELKRDRLEFVEPEDINRAQSAKEFLDRGFNKIDRDERCLSLLLECQWIVARRSRLLRGQRQPLPTDRGMLLELLRITRALNEASGTAARHSTRYFEAVLMWVTGAEQDAVRMFRGLGRDTQYEDSSRVVRRHLIGDPSGNPRTFSGRVERARSEGHWVIRVDELKQVVDLIGRDFPREEIGVGRSVRGFGIAFNYIGPIADPIGRR